MAIRKFRKHMKPFIWFITIAFALSTAIVGLMSFKDMHGRLDNYAFKLNGEKIERVEVERTKSTMSENYSKYVGKNIDRELLSNLAFDEVINKHLTLEIAKDLNVTVSSSEVNDRYKALEASIGNKEQFKRMLAAQGYTRKTYKNNIEENLLIQKTFEKIASSIKPTSKDLQDYYEENKYTAYNGESYDKVQKAVKESYVQMETMKKYFVLLGDKKAKIKITNVDPSYTKDEPKVVIKKDGFIVTNVDITKKAMSFMINKVSKEKALELAKDYYEKEIVILNKIAKTGIKVDKNLPIDYQIAEYQHLYFIKVRNEIKPTNEELLKYFEENSLRYDEFPVAQADIAIVRIVPSEKDEKEALNRAKKILKTLTPENFSEKAKELSEGPSASKGGELGWFTKDTMVTPFSTAAFETKKGEIHNKVVKTKFGYHLIYVEDRDDINERVKAKHILIKSKISDSTVAQKEKTIINELKNKKMIKENMPSEKDDILTLGTYEINNAGYISGLGYNMELKKQIFNSPIDKLEVTKMDDNNVIYVFKKLSQTKFKKAIFEEEKDKVREDYINEVANERLQDFMLNK